MQQRRLLKLHHAAVFPDISRSLVAGHAKQHYARQREQPWYNAARQHGNDGLEHRQRRDQLRHRRA